MRNRSDLRRRKWGRFGLLAAIAAGLAYLFSGGSSGTAEQTSGERMIYSTEEPTNTDRNHPLWRLAYLAVDGLLLLLAAVVDEGKQQAAKALLEWLKRRFSSNPEVSKELNRLDQPANNALTPEMKEHLREVVAKAIVDLAMDDPAFREELKRRVRATTGKEAEDEVEEP
jgi:hypothetical protein